MDPVSAVGVAAAALQFLDASIKAYNAFQEIRSSNESVTERNKQLEDNIRSAQSLRGSLPSASAPQGAIDPVSKLTTKCTLKADELLKLLKYVRGSGEDISSIRATLRAMKKEKRIKELHGFLKEDQDTLNQMISQELLPSINLLTVQQSREFANISSIAQKLIKEQIEQQRIHHATLTSKLDSIQHDMQLRNNADYQESTRKELLKSLWFPEIDQRRNEIKEPAPSTLHWLFEPPIKRAKSRYSPKWSDFREWLREDASTYWISGKAGSGKSTLMAHIVNDERTLEDLDAWSSGYKLEVLSFFFWRAGSSLQNSVLGLLRSLLYQLCVLQPAISDHICGSLSSLVGIPTWTEKCLLENITKAIQLNQGFRFCIFVDGLDEYRGLYDDLVDCIEKLTGFGHVKACVSSRPELELVNRFQDVKQLRLQDLNRGDIEKFVKQALAKTHLNEDQRTSLTRDVVCRAEGVFLWASLVTQALVKGSKAGDDEEIMQKRLDSLPRDMNQLFERILSDVEPVYRDSLGFYIQLMMMTTNWDDWIQKLRSIAAITAMLSTKDINSYEKFAEECERTRTQIINRSAGLLEVIQTDSLRINKWRRKGLKFIPNEPCFTLELKRLNRRRCTETEPCPTMLIYEKQCMTWIHRSAFEFFSDQKRLPVEFNLSDEETLRRIGEGYMRYIVAAPSLTHSSHSLNTDSRFDSLFSFLARRHNRYPDAVLVFLENIYSIYAQFDPFECHVADPTYADRVPLEIDEHIAPIAFWSKCAKFGLWSYLYPRIDCVLKDAVYESHITHLLLVSIRAGYGSKRAPGANFSPWVKGLVEDLYQRIIQGLEIGGVAQPTRYRCIEEVSSCYPLENPFQCVTWKEPVSVRYTRVMLYLLNVIISVERAGEARLLQESAAFSGLLSVTELYVALDLGLDRIYIQLSGEAFITARIKPQGVIGSCVSAAEVNGAVRILCFPSSMLKGEYSQLITLQPSTAISDQLLSLIEDCADATRYDKMFRMIPGMYQQREKVCKVLLEEIESAEQGLDGDQQLVAAACVKAGLLYPDGEHECAWRFQFRPSGWSSTG
ncbi:hypothetical protein F5Y10DRAFT_291294 [Nemania abortiva]|nr:hypothetical protein F5Y10DRAFT_291294 [Nemania abortiva]